MNEVPGSRPLPLAMGEVTVTRTEQVATLTVELLVEGDRASFNVRECRLPTAHPRPPPRAVPFSRLPRHTDGIVR